MKNLKPFLSQIFLYIGFHIITWGIHLSVLSIVAFFHFNLEHSMTILDGWIFSKAWVLSLISKICATFIIIKLITIKSNFRSPIKEILKKSKKQVSHRSLVIMIFCVFSFIYMGRGLLFSKEQFRLLEFFSSFAGSFLFYGLDILVILFLDYFYKISLPMKLLKILIYPLVFLFFTKTTFYIDVQNVSMVYFYASLLMISYSFLDYNWMNAFLFIAFIIAPFNALLGLDIMWGDRFSLLSISSTSKITTILTVVFLSVLCWYLSTKSDVKSPPV